MKRLLILFTILLGLQACKDEITKSWDVDSLNVTVSGNLSDKGGYFEAGDGNWGVHINPDFGGILSLNIQTDQSWDIDVQYLTGQEDWILPTATSGNGQSLVEVDIASNTVAEYRKAVLTIRSKGEIPIQKQITIIQKNMGVMEIDWDYLFSDEEIVFGPNTRSNLVIGRYDSKGDDVQGSSEDDWAQISVENGEVKLQLADFSGTGESRSTTLRITNLNGGITESIQLTQYASEDLSAKNTWTIEIGNDKTTATAGEPITRIIDGDINTHWQWGWNNSATSDFPNTPYEFIIDLGSAQMFNTFTVWQTQSATNGYVKDVQFKVSDDKSEWTDLGVYRLASSSADATANKFRTFTLSHTHNKRYIRLIVLSNVGDSQVNNAKNAYLGEFSAFLK